MCLLLQSVLVDVDSVLVDSVLVDVVICLVYSVIFFFISVASTRVSPAFDTAPTITYAFVFLPSNRIFVIFSKRALKLNANTLFKGYTAIVCLLHVMRFESKVFLRSDSDYARPGKLRAEKQQKWR